MLSDPFASAFRVDTRSDFTDSIGRREFEDGLAERRCRCRGGLPISEWVPAERVRRLGSPARTADFWSTVFIDDDFETRIHRDLGRFELEFLDGPLPRLLILMGAVEHESPILHPREELLDEAVKGLAHLLLNLVDGLGRNIPLLRARLTRAEFAGSLDANGRGRHPERIADVLEGELLIGNRVLNDGWVEARYLVDADGALSTARC